jgi:hypothetical protein
MECFNISVTLASVKCKLPDDGHRPKHVGAILILVIIYNLEFSKINKSASDGE